MHTRTELETARRAADATLPRRRLPCAPLLVALLVASACVPVPRSTAGEETSPSSTWVHGREPGRTGTGETWGRATAARQTRLDGDGSQLLVQARLNDRVSGTFLLDTGASYCVITPETARRLGLRGEEGEQPITLATPTGEIEAAVTTLRSVVVGNAHAGDVRAVIYPAVEEPLAGILGLSFLSQFEFSVDTRRRLLTLRPF
jgi:aspartyl protease family protein